jgi:ADP-ribose pyrophosphatase YjhB (NUDIX family)
VDDESKLNPNNVLKRDDQPDYLPDRSGPSSTNAPQPGKIDDMASALADSPDQPSPDPAVMPRRRAARVVLLDPENRVLLMRYDEGPPNGSHWATPGGGLEPGESYPRAALRELAEETGWNDIELLGEIHRRSHTMAVSGQLVYQAERLYLARTDQPARQISGVDAMHASDGIAAWRWWTVAELASTEQTIWPAELAQLIRKELGDA